MGVLSRYAVALTLLSLLFLTGIVGNAHATAAVSITVTPSNHTIYVDQNSIASLPYNVIMSGAASYALSVTATANNNTGTSNYCDATYTTSSSSYDDLITMSSIAGGSYTCPNNGGTIKFGFDGSPYSISITAQNLSGGGSSATFNSVFYINPQLSYGPLILNPSIVYTGGQDTAETMLGGGTVPFTVTATYGSSASCSSDTNFFGSASGVTSNTASASNTVPTTPGTYYFCSSVQDSSYDSAQTISSAFPTALTVVSPPSISLSSSIPSSADAGQQIGAGFAVHNGIGPFYVSAYVPSNSTNASTANEVSLPNTSGSLTFKAPITAGTYTYKLKGADRQTNNGGSGTIYSFYSNNVVIQVSNALANPFMTLSSNAVEQGQPLSGTFSWTGGTAPYDVSLYLYNKTSNAVVSNLAFNSIPGNSILVNIFRFEANPGIYYVKAVVTDSSGAGAEQNSTVANLNVTPGPQVFQTFSSNSLTYPSSPSITVNAISGTAPYSFTLNVYSSNGATVYTNSGSLSNSLSALTYNLITLFPGTYTSNVVLTDSANPAVTVNSIESFVINGKQPTLSLHVPSSFNYSATNATITASVFPTGLTGNLLLSTDDSPYVPVSTINGLSNTIVYNAPATAGSYSIELSTDANNIYAAATDTANYVINKLQLHPTISILPSNNILYNTTNVTINYSIATYPNSGYGAYLYENNALILKQTEQPLVVNNFNISLSNGKLYGAATTQNQSYVYVTSFGDNIVSAISTRNNSVVKQITNGLSGPIGIVIPNNGPLAYVANYKNGTVAVLNLSSDSVVKDIPLSSNSLILSQIEPYYIAASPSGSEVYVTDYGTGQLSVINTTTDSVQNVTLGLGSDPIAINTSVNGNEIYVASNNGNSDLYIIKANQIYTNPSGAVSTITIPVPSGNYIGYEMAAYGNNLYIPVYSPSYGEQSQNVQVYNTITGSFSSIDNTNGTTAVAVMGGNLYELYERSTRLTATNLTTGNLVFNSTGEYAYNGIYITPANGKLYVINLDNDISVVTSKLITGFNSKAPLDFNFSYSLEKPAAGEYGIKIVPSLPQNSNYTGYNALDTLTVRKGKINITASTFPGNSVYNGKNSSITFNLSELGKFGVNATLNSAGIILPGPINANPISAAAKLISGAIYKNNLYVQPYLSSYLIEINTSSLSSKTISYPSGSTGWGIAISNSTGLAYIVNSHNTANVMVIDLNNDLLLYNITLPSGSDPFYDALSKNQNILYVSGYGSDSVYAINLTTNSIASIPLSGALPYYLTPSPNGKTLYVSGYYQNVYFINTSTNTLFRTVSTTPYYYVGQVSVSPNNQYIYVPNYENQLSYVINASTGAVVKEISGYYPYVTAVSGNYAYFFNYYYYEGGVTIMNTTTNKIVLDNFAGGNVYNSGFDGPNFAAGTSNGVYIFDSASPYIVSFSSLLHSANYSLPAAPGSYTLNFTIPSVYADNYTLNVPANIVYTISKATPNLTLTSIPSSFVETGNEINVNYSISSLQPLAGTLTLNGNIIATYPPNSQNIVETATVNAVSPGSYTLEFSAPGNGNYLPANIIDSFFISSAAAHSSLSSTTPPQVYSTQNTTITGTITSNAVGNLYMSVNGGNYVLVGTTGSASNTVTYNAPAAAGVYSFKFYNNPTTAYAEGLSFLNYTITKGIPSMSLSSCSSYVYDGSSCTINASISSIDGQINGNLYYNGALVGTTNSVISYTGSNAIGSYTVEFETAGNGNYISKTEEYTYSITSKKNTSTGNTGLPSGGGGGGGIPPTTVTPTTTVTTTIPQHSIVTGSSDRTYVSSGSISAGSKLNISFTNMNAAITFTTNSKNQSSVNFSVSNYTASLPPTPAGHRFVEGIAINFTSGANVTANVTLKYNCSLGSSVAPYVLENGEAVAIKEYSVDSSSCTLSFSLSSDPVVLVYANQTNSSQTPSTTPTTVPPTVQPTSAPTQKSDTIYLAIGVIILVVVIGGVAYYLSTKRRR